MKLSRFDVRIFLLVSACLVTLVPSTGTFVGVGQTFDFTAFFCSSDWVIVRFNVISSMR